MKNHFFQVRKFNRLWEAWLHIEANASKSNSASTKEGVKLFRRDAPKIISKMQTLLRADDYKFEPALGILQKKSGKKTPRPIVVSTIRDRIMQRAILTVLQDDVNLKEFFEVPSSFGGIEERGVSLAVEVALKAIKNGAAFYLKSDISNFFGGIPKTIVFEKVEAAGVDPLFMKLFRSATEVELSNLSEVGEYKNLFPDEEIGIAQGCCLSPLVGNLLLSDFDNELNFRDIVCLRYIDDFLILGPSEKAVRAAFKRAKLKLAQYQLKAYEIDSDNDKAEVGPISQGFDFLGCRIKGGQVSPGTKGVESIKKKISQVVAYSIGNSGDPRKTQDGKSTFVETCLKLGLLGRSWGNQYSFCNSRKPFEHVESHIDVELKNLQRVFFKRMREVGNLDKRRLLGVFPLEDCKKAPIETIQSATV